MIWNSRFLIIENCFYATAYCESYWQTMVNLTTICPSKLPGMLIALWHAPFTPSNLSIQRGDQSAFFLLTGHYEWGHSWQQWSVPFRWSPWQRLQTQREREREERERETESAGPQLCAVWIPTLVFHFFSLHVTSSLSLHVKVHRHWNLNIITRNILHLVTSSYRTSQMVYSSVHLHKAWRCQIKQTPTRASAAREYWEGRSMIMSLSGEYIYTPYNS